MVQTCVRGVKGSNLLAWGEGFISAHVCYPPSSLIFGAFCAPKLTNLYRTHIMMTLAQFVNPIEKGSGSETDDRPGEEMYRGGD